MYMYISMAHATLTLQTDCTCTLILIISLLQQQSLTNRTIAILSTSVTHARLGTHLFGPRW